MSTTRPITDTIFCANTKVKWPCSYPSGLLEALRRRLGSDPRAAWWHFCGGMAHMYNNANEGRSWGYGDRDMRLDIDPAVKPDFLCDIREIENHFFSKGDSVNYIGQGYIKGNLRKRAWLFSKPDAIIIDPDYDQANADRHAFSELIPLETVADIARLCLHGIVRRAGFVVIFHVRSFSLGADCLQTFHLPVAVAGKCPHERVATVWQLKDHVDYRNYPRIKT